MAVPLSLLIRLWYMLLQLACVNAYTKLTDESLRAIKGPGDAFNIKTGALLAPILIPRVAGTDGSTKVQEHFANFFRTNLSKWNVTYQNSTSKTPATGDKDIPFINMIVTRDPPWSKPGEVSYLTLAAHYDSKLTPHNFIGATDSAAPCAMLLHAARAVDEALTRKWDSMEKEGLDGFDTNEHSGVQILLLDGEESFVSWTDTDSTYGSRALAQEWEATPHPVLSTFRNPLASISLFVLLDLLGAKEPTVPSYYKTTHWAYLHMADLEQRLRGLGLFKSSPNHPKKGGRDARRAEPAFLTDARKNTGSDRERWFGGMIGDDHLPFMARGVEILHLITSPFPDTWHTMQDDGEHLDLDTVEDWSTLVTAFVGEWMELDGLFDNDGSKLVAKSEL